MWKQFTALIATLLLLVRSVEMTPSTIKISGVFNNFDANDNSDLSQLQQLSAFLLAVDEINNRTDILPNTRVEVVMKHGYSTQNAAKSALELVSAGVVAGVTAINSPETSSIHTTLSDSGIVFAHSKASATEFGDGTKYPYKVQTNPIDSYQGMVVQHLLCNYFQYDRVIIFANNDDFGTKTTVESGDGTFCDLENIASYFIPPYESDFTQYIQRARSTDVTVFLIFMNTKSTAMLLEQGYDQGLFIEGTQVISSASVLDPDLFEYFSPGSDATVILQGMIGIQYFPNYQVLEEGADSKFVQLWRNQSSSSVDCSTRVDSLGYHYLYPDGDTSKTCVGLDFASFHANASNIDPYAALTYDATHLLLRGIDALFNSGETSVDGEKLMDALFNVSFIGATNIVEIFSGMPDFGWYGRGDREVGHHYRVMNFNPTAYKNNESEVFNLVKLWTIEDGVFDCIFCSSDFIYRTPDNSMPSSYPPYAFAHPPEVIKIGGLFSPFDSDGNANLVQAENLAAFLMAVEHINNKTDGIDDDILPNSKIRVAVQFGSSFSEAVTAVNGLLASFYDSGVLGVVSGLPNLETMASNQILGDKSIVQAHSMAQDTNFGDGEKYPFKVQTCPIDSFQGMILQHIFCTYFQYKKVTIFGTNDEFGTKAAMESGDGTYCDLDVLSSHIFRSDLTDYSDVIADAKQAGAQVFFLLMSAKNAAGLLEQGYEHGLFHEGTQVMMVRQATENITNYFSADAHVSSIMRGVLSVSYWPKYSLSRTEKGAQFLSEWTKHANTGLRNYGDEHTCNLRMDDSQTTFLFANEKNVSQCSGVDYATALSDGSGLTDYAALTYDATMLLIRGIDVLLKANDTSFKGTNRLLRSILWNVSFEGATGDIDIFPGSKSQGFYGQGDREIGHHYRLMQFHKSAYLNNPSDPFVQVRTWSVEEGVVPCDSQVTCYEFEFNTADGLPALDTPPDKIVVLSAGGRGFLIAMAVLTILLVLCLSVLLFKYHSSKLIKASQPVMLYFILAGEVLAAIRVLIAGLPITDASCTAGLWFGHMSFVFVFGALFVKTWRVNRIVNNTGIKRVKITNTDVTVIMCVTILAASVYLAILTGVGVPHQTAISTTASNLTTREIRCTLHVPVLHTILFAIEAAVLLVGARLCWAVKDVPDAVNESKFIAAAMTIIVMMCSLVFPIVFLIDLSPPIQQVIASVSFAMAAISSSMIIMGPKFMKLMRGEDVDKNFGVSKAPVAAYGSAPIAPKGHHDEHEAVVASSQAMKSLSLDEKVKFCHEQVGKWRAMLMQLNDRSSGSGSGSASGKTSSGVVRNTASEMIVEPNDNLVEPFKQEIV